jgi:polyisoprenyl-teichoic acid--peptidoglycan teichoic acid transferase
MSKRFAAHNSQSKQHVPETVQGSSLLPAFQAPDDPLHIPPPPIYSDDNTQGTQASNRRSKDQPAGSGDWAWLLSGMIAFAFVVVASVGAFAFFRSIEGRITSARPDVQASAERTNSFGISSRPALPTPIPAHDLTIAQSQNETAASEPETLSLPDGRNIALVPWDGTSRFTIIVAGIDRRPGETGLAYRTDSMMLVSVDPATQALGILSLPRDLYINLPTNNDLLRINTPLAYGEGQRNGYGPTLLMQSVQYNLGIRVHEYLIVDFQAFIDLINAIGGIDVETHYTIDDPYYPNMNYGYDPFYLPAGRHHLNGYDALRFARTRHGDSDIERAERQQQVIGALRHRLLRLDMLPSLLAQAPQLWASWSDHVHTGLTLEQVVQLALYLKDIPSENIRMGVVGYDYLQDYRTARGESVLIPNRSALSQLLNNVFGPNYGL